MNTNENNYYTHDFYVPQSISEDTLLKIYNISNIQCRFSTFRSRVIKLLDKLIRIKYQKFNKTYGFQIKRCVLENILSPRHTTSILSALAQAKILSIDRHYIVGKKCRQYTLANGVLENGHRIVELKVRSAVHPNRENWKEKKAILLKSPHFVIRNTVKFLDRLEVPKIDLDGIIFDNEGKKHALAHRLNALKNKEFHCSVDKFGRLHSNFTNLDKIARNKLLLYGAPLVEIDMRACFPTLLYKYVTDEAEQQKYRQWLFEDKKDFYSAIMNSMQTNDIPYNGVISRNLIKKGFNAWLNGGRKYDYIADVLRIEFPLLYQEIMKIRKRNDRKIIGCQLMESEAKIMISSVLTKMWNHDDDMPVLSLHDAFYCHSHAANSICEMVINEVETHIGIRPIVLIKNALEDNKPEDVCNDPEGYRVTECLQVSL